MATALTTALHRVKPEETSRESLLELHRIEMIGESPMDLQWISNGSSNLDDTERGICLTGDR